MNLRSGAWTLIVLGALIIIAILILSGKPAPLQQPSMPSSTSQGTSSTLPYLTTPVASLPDFAGITHWWNTSDGQPLTPEKLKGKVVLVDFWTYSCINCIRTQPVLKQWWSTYEKDGLVIVGVHTPEFDFEKDPANVAEAIQKAGLTYPIALDPDYATWNAYDNHYWPAEYLFDRNGRLRYTHFGEGNYAESEDAIRSLLAETEAITQPPTGADTTPKFEMIRTPETYFGYARAEAFANQSELKQDAAGTYTLQTPGPNAWSIGGQWTITKESATADAPSAAFRMSVDANAMYLVLGSTGGDKRAQILVDGKNPTDDELTADAARQSDDTVWITVNGERLYRIAQFPNGGRHLVELRLPDAGVEFYAATFGE